MSPSDVARSADGGRRGENDRPAWDALADVLNMVGAAETLATLGSLLAFDAVQWHSSIDRVPEMERAIVALARTYAPARPSDEESRAPF